jgi:hypothetical protein
VVAEANAHVRQVRSPVVTARGEERRVAVRRRGLDEVGERDGDAHRARDPVRLRAGER